jgi:hypothetical protein
VRGRRHAIARIAVGLPGIVNAGTLAGAAATPIASAASTDATATVAGARHGSSRSAAINAAINAIHTRLIAPSANSATINAQQQAFVMEIAIREHRRSDRGEHHRGHHHDPGADVEAEGAGVGPRSSIHAGHPQIGRCPGDAGEGEQRGDHGDLPAERRGSRARTGGEVQLAAPDVVDLSLATHEHGCRRIQSAVVGLGVVARLYVELAVAGALPVAGDGPSR